MSLSSQLARLENQRRRELDLLRAHSTALSRSFQDDATTQWIRDHPYLATATAALVGLTIAQLPLPTLTSRHATLSSPSVPASIYADLLPHLLNLTIQLLEPVQESPATVTPDDSFTLSTSTFPHPFSPPAPEPTESHQEET